MSKTLKHRIRTLEEKTVSPQSFAAFDPLGLDVESIPLLETLTDAEKERIAKERMKTFIKRNWSRMDPDIKKSYMEKLGGLGLRLHGESVEEVPAW
jgi:hypothetical protein